MTPDHSASRLTTADKRAILLTAVDAGYLGQQSILRRRMLDAIGCTDADMRPAEIAWCDFYGTATAGAWSAPGIGPWSAKGGSWAVRIDGIVIATAPSWTAAVARLCRALSALADHADVIAAELSKRHANLPFSGTEATEVADKRDAMYDLAETLSATAEDVNLWGFHEDSRTADISAPLEPFDVFSVARLGAYMPHAFTVATLPSAASIGDGLDRAEVTP